MTDQHVTGKAILRPFWKVSHPQNFHRIIMMLMTALFVFLLGSPLSAQESGEPHQIKFWTSDKIELEHYFPYQLLELALSKTDLNYTLSTISVEEEGVTSEEVGFLMAKPQVHNIHYIRVAGTSESAEKNLNPIYFPIYRGLLGYRLFAIRANDQEKFSAIHNEDELRKLIALQGEDWVDTAILREAGYRVKTGEFSELFPWLHEGKGDYFPRGITEIDQIDDQPFDDVVLEESLYMYYPLVMYYFLAPGDHRLQAELEHALVAAMRDGSYEALFKQNSKYMHMIERAHIGDREGVFIQNDHMSERSKNLPPEYLYTIKELLALQDGD